MFRPLIIPKFSFLSIVTLCIVVWAGGVKTAAQDSLRKVVYGAVSAPEKKNAPTRKKADVSKKSSVNPSSKTKNQAGVSVKKKQTGTAGTVRRPIKRPGWITVVFESRLPNTQIFLNGNPIGSTDDSRKFQWVMTPGAYRVTGMVMGNTVFPERHIQLRTDEMTVRVFEEVAVKPPEKEQQPLIIPKTQAEIEMDIAREMSTRVIQIFSNFLDPQKSKDVTTDDWRFAANAAVLGEFQNLSSQQIEAQRKFASGQVNLAEDNHQKAFNDFRLSVQSFQGSPLPHIGLGDAYFASAQWQDARRSYEQAKIVGPTFWMAHRRLGDTYRILGEKKRAILAYTDAIKFGDKRYETRFLRARAMVDAENMETAIPLLEELAKEEARSEVYLSLGEAYEMLKRDVGALDHYRKAVELDPQSSVAQYRLARIYYEQREYQKAVEGFDAALKLDGDKKSFPHDDAAEKKSAALSRIKTTSR